MNRDMNRQEVESLTRIGRSLWGDLARAIEMSEETLGTVSLLNLGQERTMERTVRVLIERAEQAPPSSMKMNHPFFRLVPLERFLLTAISVEKWSYEKVARVLEVDVTTIEPWIWSIRLRYSFELLGLSLDYPHGPSTLGPSCPEYQPSSPWTQRM
jgi:DNA-directed RNA polymerase specialized sigma24 family protein